MDLDDFEIFQNLVRGVATSLGIQVELIQENLHNHLNILQTSTLGRVALPINNALLELARTLVADSSLYTTYSQEITQMLPSRSIEFTLFFHTSSTHWWPRLPMTAPTYHIPEPLLKIQS